MRSMCVRHSRHPNKATQAGMTSCPEAQFAGGPTRHDMRRAVLNPVSTYSQSQDAYPNNHVHLYCQQQHLLKQDTRYTFYIPTLEPLNLKQERQHYDCPVTLWSSTVGPNTASLLPNSKGISYIQPTMLPELDSRPLGRLNTFNKARS